MLEKIYKFLDPKKALWLEILRWYIIVVALIIFFGSVIFAFYAFIDISTGSWSDPLYGLFSFIVIIVMGIVANAVHIITGMLLLNLLYNVQQIKLNTEKYKLYFEQNQNNIT